MATVALFYNRQDASQIAAEATRVDLSGADKTFAQRLWNGGLKDWSSAPVAPANSPYFGEGVAAGSPTLMFVVSGTGVTKQAISDWLRRLASTSASYYLEAIAVDLLTSAVEPWPPA